MSTIHSHRKQKQHGCYDGRHRVSLLSVRSKVLFTSPLDSILTTCLVRTVDIPLPTARLASVAVQALGVDKELSHLVRRTLSTVVPAESKEESVLRAKYVATTNRMLRVAVNSFMDSLALVLEVQEQLDVDVLEARNAKS